MTRLALWVTALVGALLVLARVPMSVSDADPIVAAFAVVRVLALGTGWYLIGVTVLGVLARASRVPALVRSIDVMTVAPVRRLLHASMTATVTISTLTTAPAYASHGPTTHDPPVLRPLRPDGADPPPVIARFNPQTPTDLPSETLVPPGAWRPPGLPSEVPVPPGPWPSPSLSSAAPAPPGPWPSSDPPSTAPPPSDSRPSTGLPSAAPPPRDPRPASDSPRAAPPSPDPWPSTDPPSDARTPDRWPSTDPPTAGAPPAGPGPSTEPSPWRGLRPPTDGRRDTPEVVPPDTDPRARGAPSPPGVASNKPPSDTAPESGDVTTADPPAMRRLVPAPSHDPARVLDEPHASQPPPQPGGTWVVRSGESLWSIAATVANGQSEASITSYWLRLIEANRSRLADPENVDLLFTHQELALPTLQPP